MLSVVILTTGCSVLSFLSVYKVNVDQGNIVNQDTINDLKLGMTKRQVIFVMGTPLVVDPFNTDVWGYYYGVEVKNSRKKYEQNVTLTFEDNELVSIEGDLQPDNPVKEEVKPDKEPKKTIKLSPKTKSE